MADKENEQLTELQEKYAYSDPASVQTQEPQSKELADVDDRGIESEVAEAEDAGQEEEVSGLSPELLQHAILSGFSPEEAGAFSSDQDLQRAVNVATRALASAQTQAPPADAPPPPAAWKGPEITLSEEDADPEVLKQFKALTKAYDEAIAGVNNNMGAMADMLMKSEQRETFRRFDQHISRLPEAARKKLGKGPSDGMKPGQPGYGERDKLYRMMDGLFQARPDISEAEAFDLAASTVLGKKRQRSAGIARPNSATQRSAATTDRVQTEDERMANLTERYKEMTRQ